MEENDCPFNCRICDFWGYERCPQRPQELIDRSSPYYLELLELKEAVEYSRAKRRIT
jgi:hypothetical protein